MEIERNLVQLVLAVLFTSGLAVGLIYTLFYSYRSSKKLVEEHQEKLHEKEIQRVNSILEAQELERANIARDLHDDVGTILSLSQQKIMQTTSLLQAQGTKESLVEELHSATDMLEQSIAKLRAITYELLPHFLLKFGFIKALERMFDQAQLHIGKPCLLTIELPKDFQLRQEEEMHLYYIFSELLNNLIKHSKPNYIDGSLRIEEGAFKLGLRHDGVAISQEDYQHLKLKNTGIGLFSMSHRLNILQGDLYYQRLDHGGSITLTLALKTHENS